MFCQTIEQAGREWTVVDQMERRKFCSFYICNVGEGRALTEAWFCNLPFSSLCLTFSIRFRVKLTGWQYAFICQLQLQFIHLVPSWIYCFTAHSYIHSVPTKTQKVQCVTRPCFYMNGIQETILFLVDIFYFQILCTKWLKLTYCRWWEHSAHENIWICDRWSKWTF